MIGENVRRRRILLGFTLREVATKSKLSKGFVSQIETGRARPSVSSLQRIARALGVSVEALLVSPQSGVNVSLPGYAASGSSANTPVFRPAHAYPGAVTPVTSLSTSGEVIVALVTLPAGSTLAHAEGEQSVKGARALCFCQTGSVSFVSANHSFLLNAGDMVEWEVGGDYRLTNIDASRATLLLIWPHSLPLPRVTSIQNLSPRRRTRLQPGAEPAFRAARPTGPFQLVEMRAERTLARKR